MEWHKNIHIVFEFTKIRKWKSDLFCQLVWDEHVWIEMFLWLAAMLVTYFLNNLPVQKEREHSLLNFHLLNFILILLKQLKYIIKLSCAKKLRHIRDAKWCTPWWSENPRRWQFPRCVSLRPLWNTSHPLTPLLQHPCTETTIVDNFQDVLFHVAWLL